MTVYLVRHGHAGDREEWDGPDHLRPLDEVGRKQAEQLADVLAGLRGLNTTAGLRGLNTTAGLRGLNAAAGLGVERIISSPFVRCVETVEPLAERVGVPVETSDALAEGPDVDETVRLIRSVAGTTVVLCTHGDVVPRLLERLEELDGLPLPEDYPYDKGSTWVLEPDETGRFVRAAHLPPLV